MLAMVLTLERGPVVVVVVDGGKGKDDESEQNSPTVCHICQWGTQTVTNVTGSHILGHTWLFSSSCLRASIALLTNIHYVRLNND